MTDGFDSSSDEADDEQGDCDTPLPPPCSRAAALLMHAAAASAAKRSASMCTEESDGESGDACCSEPSSAAHGLEADDCPGSVCSSSGGDSAAWGRPVPLPFVMAGSPEVSSSCAQ